MRATILFLRRVAALGYQFLVRLSLAAMASLVSSASAGAGSIEGAVTFPTQLVPSMTVYASDLDTLKIRSVQLLRGQANFTVEVPPGRYLVFLAPNEPGAPNIYGAYTQYCLCASHDIGKCEDHTLVPIAISARVPRAAVMIDDWYLTDAVAEQIDHIRGVAAGFQSESLSAPRFSEYPSAPFDPSAEPKVGYGGSDLKEEDREIVQRALSSGPNFAGHVTVALTACGLACGRLVLIDWRNGAIQELPPQDTGGPKAAAAITSKMPAALAIQGTLPCRADEALVFRRDSRLLRLTRVRGTAVVTQYYVWNQKNAALVQNGEYQRTSQTFCAVAAR
jgi:hypothetical protein